MWLEHSALDHMPPPNVYACWESLSVKICLPKVGGFNPGVLWFPPPVKSDRHNITLNVESGFKLQSLLSTLSR